MITRIIILLVCVLIFVNSCNSFISGVAGTHKLRTFTIDEVREKGLADADFVEINQAFATDDFIFVPNRNESWPGFVEFPILDEEQIDSLAAGVPVNIYLIGWTQKYDEACVENNNCIVGGGRSFKGLVRRMNKRFDKLNQLSSKGYNFVEDPIYIEIDRSPLAWYWNIAMMVGAIGVAFGIEQWLGKKEKKEAV